MEIKNIKKAFELIPTLEALAKARKMLCEPDACVSVDNGGASLALPPSLRLNILNVVNCEYERVREEVCKL